MKRTFVAIKIKAETGLLKVIYDFKNILRNDKINWVEENNLHLTLKFLGNTDENLLKSICEKLEKIAFNQTNFSLTLCETGLFKNVKNPKILWIGINESANLDKLKFDIELGMENFAYQIDKKDFSPHLTIGRIKWIENKKLLENLIEKYNGIKFQSFEVNEFIFYESILSSKSPVYKIIDIFQFK